MLNDGKKRLLVTGLVISNILIVVFYYYLIPFKTVEPVYPQALELKDLDGLEEDDPMLIAYAKYLIFQPASRSLPYFLTRPNVYSGNEDAAMYMLSKLHNKTNGFFLDCGSYDGEDSSVSLPLEKDFNWNGLMIDPTPRQIQNTIFKTRKSHYSPACLSTSNRSMMASLVDRGMQSALIDHETASILTFAARTVCIPFHTFMRALNIKHIDLFNLDVGGSELPILKTIDFNRVTIDALIVDYVNTVEDSRNEMLKMMDQNGYKLVNTSYNDYYFVHKRIEE